VNSQNSADNSSDPNGAIPSRRECGGTFQHHIKTHVYHIASKAAAQGVVNKDAADSLGDLAFIFGSAGFPSPRGVIDYYNGVIEMNHISVSSWGDYLQCNHDDKFVYSCKCPKDHTGACDMNRAGQVQNSHSNNHVWYSFPKSGQGKYWDMEKSTPKRGCRRIRIEAKCVIDQLAEAAKAKGFAGCTGTCDPKAPDPCVKCVNKLTDAEKKAIWDKAIWDGGCDDMNEPNDPVNQHRRRRTTKPTPAPKPKPNPRPAPRPAPKPAPKPTPKPAPSRRRSKMPLSEPSPATTNRPPRNDGAGSDTVVV